MIQISFFITARRTCCADPHYTARWTLYSICLLVLLMNAYPASAQHSVARRWNEALLVAVRNDFARPTVHARNLFHVSAAMYDAWAAYDDQADPYLLGNTIDGYFCAFTGIAAPVDIKAAREKAISFAAYRLLSYRFRNSPGVINSQAGFDGLMAALGYDVSITSTAYESGDPAALGNYIAQTFIDFGLQDEANEQNDYANLFYEPVNPPLFPFFNGNSDILDPNRWQPLSLNVFVDQAGHVTPFNTPDFLSPEWGAVTPFALGEADQAVYTRDGHSYYVYHDPGAPPYIDLSAPTGLSDDYKWGFALVAAWSSHLDPTDGVLWDISPASIGNNPPLPTTQAGLRSFYDLEQGGDLSRGRSVNPHTGQPYAPQIVPRGDYARVLAEFWADGPDSETPPGHWFTILNYVNDHPDLEKRFRGEGPILDDLEWDVKSYFALGGAMHDAAITAWGVKGWYDYIRPVSAIRYMAEQGQSSDANQPGYTAGGMPLIPGYAEIITAGDPLVGPNGERIGEVKVKAWRGPDYISDPDTDEAGVDWVPAKAWWPYQRPTFITPPFAGYVSGHSTYSRAAAEVLTLFTGDEYFPGGVGEFHAPKNEFLVFEEGPSVDVTLQWATYRDASDQCSLSRIWGGIHPPADDMPGRLMGEQLGVDAFLLAERYFSGEARTGPVATTAPGAPAVIAYPNPVCSGTTVHIALNRPAASPVVATLYNMLGQAVHTQRLINPSSINLNTASLTSGIYIMRVSSPAWTETCKVVILH